MSERSTLLKALRDSLPSNFEFTTGLIYKGFTDKYGRQIDLDLIIEESLNEFPDEKSFDDISDWIYDVAELDKDHFGVLTTDKFKEVVKSRKDIWKIYM